MWRMGIVAVLLAFGTGCVSLTPFAEVRARAGEDAFVRVGDQLVHVERAGSGEAVVLIHGFGGSSWSWRHVVPALAEDHRVVALDLNGFGWTERPSAPEAYTLAGQERLVLGVADALGLGRFDLAGHSYGGAISIYLAARHPERVRSLLLVDSAMPSYSALRRSRSFRNRTLSVLFVRAFALTPARVRFGLEASYADDSKVTDELVRAYLERLRVEGVGDAFHGLTAPNSEPPEQVDLASLEMPTLVVWGAQDELIPARDGRKAAETMPDAGFVELAGCGHSPMEECPEAFLAAVEPFLAVRP